MFIHIFVVVGVLFCSTTLCYFVSLLVKLLLMLPLTGSDSAITRVTTFLQNILM